jgi:hypothetical protein
MHCTAACATPRPPPTRCTALLHQRRTIHAGADEVLRRAIARSLGLTQVRRECTTARHVARAAIASSVRSMPNAMLSPWNAVCGHNMPHHRHTHTHTHQPPPPPPPPPIHHPLAHSLLLDTICTTLHHHHRCATTTGGLISRHPPLLRTSPPLPWTHVTSTRGSPRLLGGVAYHTASTAPLATRMQIATMPQRLHPAASGSATPHPALTQDRLHLQHQHAPMLLSANLLSRQYLARA